MSLVRTNVLGSDMAKKLTSADLGKQLTEKQEAELPADRQGAAVEQEGGRRAMRAEQVDQALHQKFVTEGARLVF